MGDDGGSGEIGRTFLQVHFLKNRFLIWNDWNKCSEKMLNGVDGEIKYDNIIPKEVTLEDKTAIEQVRLIAQLDEKDKNIVFGIIETMLTKKKFKDFFKKNIAML